MVGFTRASVLNSSALTDFKYWQEDVLAFLQDVSWLEQSWLDPVKDNNVFVLLILAVVVIMVFMGLFTYSGKIWSFLSGKTKYLVKKVKGK